MTVEISTAAYAAFGGLMVNGLSLLEIAKVPRDEHPDFRDFLYWLPFPAWPLAGAVLASAYVGSGTPLNPLLAINVGVSAPLVIKAMAKQSQIDPERDDA